MSNFDFIKGNSKVGNLYDFCEKAESFAFTYPEISATEARKANELCIKMIFETATGQISDGLSTFEMLDTPSFISYFTGTDIIDCMHRIRKVGNKAAHGEIVSEHEALDALEKLHKVVGETSYLLYIIDDYPKYDISKVSHVPAEVCYPEEDITINTEYLEHLRLMKKFSELVPRKPKSYIDVHVETKGNANKVDSAANNRLAFETIYNYLKDHFPGYELFPDFSAQKINIVYAGKMKTIAVKSGCSVLGKRLPDGQTSILPGVDIILYSPSVENSDIISQFRIFNCEAFYHMWDELGLVRLKVSNQVSKLIKDQSRDLVVKQKDQFADTISVQSFTNSAKKKKLVLNTVKTYPTLAHEGLMLLQKLIQEER